LAALVIGVMSCFENLFSKRKSTYWSYVGVALFHGWKRVGELHVTSILPGGLKEILYGEISMLYLEETGLRNVFGHRKMK